MNRQQKRKDYSGKCLYRGWDKYLQQWIYKHASSNKNAYSLIKKEAQFVNGKYYITSFQKKIDDNWCMQPVMSWW